MENINQITQEVSNYILEQGDNILEVTPEINELTIEILQEDNRLELFIEHISDIAEINIIPNLEPSQVTLYDIGIQGLKGARGNEGIGLNYTWSATNLGIKREDETSFIFVDLKGSKGDSLTFDTLTVEQKEELRGDVGSTETNYVNIFLNSLLS